MSDKKEKISLEEVKKIPVRHLLKMIDRAKKYLKKDEVMQRVCKEYGASIDDIDYIPTHFGDIDVSATTNHGIVTLNYKLLCDGDFYKDLGYLVHEYTHYFDQTCSAGPTQGASEGNYLDNPHEVEGFQNQLDFMAKEYGEDEAEKYTDELLKHHEIDDKEEKEKKKDELMELV